MGLHVRLLRKILLLLLVVPLAALAMTIGYDVKVQNQSAIPVKVELAQYHAEGFNGTRPNPFTENLRISARVISLQPGESQTFHYNSASGGFWLVWKTIEPSTNKSSGVLDLVAGDGVINIK